MKIRRNRFTITVEDLNTLHSVANRIKKIISLKKIEDSRSKLIKIKKMKIMASGPITSWEIDGKQWKQCQTLFFWAPKSLQIVIAAMKLKDSYSLEGKL